MPTAPAAAYTLALLQAGLACIQDVAVAGARYNHLKVATFQTAWNNAVAAGALAGTAAPNQAIAADGVWGPHTAAAMGHTLPSGLPPVPTLPTQVAAWWTPIKANVLGMAGQLQQQIGATISSSMPADVPGSAAPQDLLNTILPSSQQTAQAATDAATSNTPVRQSGGTVALPGSLIQGQAPSRKTPSWPWIVGGLTLATLLAGFAWAASQKKRGRRR